MLIFLRSFEALHPGNCGLDPHWNVIQEPTGLPASRISFRVAATPIKVALIRERSGTEGTLMSKNGQMA